MQQLLSQICTNYIGIQYTKIIVTLYSKPQTLQSLIEASQESYKHLIEKIKYLINLNIVTFEKSLTKGVLYSINVNTILFFQRVVKYYLYIEENTSKEQTKILHYFLEVMTSNFESYIKCQGIKTEQIERNKQIFAGLIKAGYLYEDEKALDLGLCERRENDVDEKHDEKPTHNEDQEKQKQIQTKETTKGGKLTKKTVGKKTSQSKEKQTVAPKSTKKQEIKLSKSESKLNQTKQSADTGIISKLSNSNTYFSISLNFILNKIKDQLIVRRLKSKFSTDKSLKHLLQIVNSQKYEAPFDIYNSSYSTPKASLLKDIKVELVEQFIYLRFGRNSLLVYKTLAESEYITQKSLSKFTLLELKQLRSSINCLYVSGIVKSVEVKIERANTMVFWIDEQVANRQYLGFLTKTCLNLDILVRRYKNQMVREQNQGLRVTELEHKLCRLQANLLEVDDCLILYNS